MRRWTIPANPADLNSVVLRADVDNQFNKTADTALANVTGLALTLAASAKYIFEAKLFVDATVAGGHKYALDGTVTVTGIKYEVKSINDNTAQLVLASRLTALAGTAGQSGAASVYTEIKGLIASSAAGTLNVQFAQENASGTSSVLTQSSFMAVRI